MNIIPNHKKGGIGTVLLTAVVVLVVLVGIGYGISRHNTVASSSNPNYQTAVVTSTSTVAVATSTPSTSVIPNLPNTGGSAGSVSTVAPVTSPVSPAVSPSSSAGIRLIFPNTVTALTVGKTYAISWSASGIVPSAYSQFRVEVISASRIDKGPELIAAYTGPLSTIPRTISWTVPATLDRNDTYQVRIIYKTSAENYFGDQGFAGRVYTDASDYPFSINTTMDQEIIQLTSDAPATLSVTPGTNSIHALTFFLTPPVGKDALITELGVGSERGNEALNSVENLQVIDRNGTSISGLEYENQFLAGSPLYKLTHPIMLKGGQMESFTITADLKPGVSGLTIIPLEISGGRGNMTISGAAMGDAIVVSK